MPVEVRIVSKPMEGIQVHQIDVIDRPTGKRQFQVWDVRTGQIIVEARTRRGAEAKLLRLVLQSRFRVMRHGSWVGPEPTSRTMKMKVKRVDGRTEILTLHEPLSFRNGPDDSILQSGFVDHFFCEDGRYNGWGTNASTRDARNIEKNRVIED